MMLGQASHIPRPLSFPLWRKEKISMAKMIFKRFECAHLNYGK